MNTDKIKRKETIRISKKDLLKLLADNEHYQKQITELQARGTELVTENRELKRQLAERQPQFIPIEIGPPIPPPSIHPDLGPDIYFDNSYGLRDEH